jgi:hypothetical protein
MSVRETAQCKVKVQAKQIGDTVHALKATNA